MVTQLVFLDLAIMRCQFQNRSNKFTPKKSKGVITLGKGWPWYVAFGRDGERTTFFGPI